MAFQGMVALIEKAMQQAEGVTIESPGFVLDSGGERREHDVLIRRKVGLHEIVTAVECRDKSRKLGLNDLEAFARKCERTGVDHRVMVSARGFCKSALRAAPAERIQCLSLQQVAGFDWLGTSAMIETRRNFTKIDAQVFAKTKIVEPFELYGSDGSVVTPQVLVNVANKAMSENDLPEPFGREEPGNLHVKWQGTDCHVVDANGERHDVDYVVIDAVVEITDTPKPFKLHTYEGDHGRVEIMSSTLDIEGKESEMVMVRNAEGLVSFVIAPK
ncbi:MAG: hypothetical protein IM674_03900 [Brevundimonas sp.]|nr:hypothetical protein [Brevundimonas sp.]